jgi:hypothetical protein
MAECEAPRVVGGAHEAPLLDDVEGAERVRPVERGDSRREVEVEGVARDRGGLHERSRVGRQRLDLGTHGGHDAAGQLVRAAVARELREQQRIAARLGVQPVALAGPGHAGEQRLGGPALERAQVEGDEADGVARALRREQALGRRARP